MGWEKGIFPLHKDISVPSYIPILRTFLLRCYDLIAISNSLYVSVKSISLSNFPILVNDRSIFLVTRIRTIFYFFYFALMSKGCSLDFPNSFHSCIFFCHLINYNMLPKFLQSSKLFSQLPGSPLFWFISHTAGKLLSLKYNFCLSLRCSRIFCGIPLHSE